MLITDREFSADDPARAALMERPPLVIDIDDRAAPKAATCSAKRITRPCSRKAIPTSLWSLPEDEWDAIALNYTSGTTGNPKGVVNHHRGAYLNALSNVVSWAMPHHPVYLWTLPMFHCNGWCFPWTMAAVAGTNVCLRRADPSSFFEPIRDDGVTHMCAAPIVYNMLINAADELPASFGRKINGFIAGSAPPASDDRGHGTHRLRPHPRLWPYRNLRPRIGMRQARGMGILPRPSAPG